MLALFAAGPLAAGCAHTGRVAGDALAPFASERALAEYLRRGAPARPAAAADSSAAMPDAVPTAAAGAAASAPAYAPALSRVAPSGAAPGGDARGRGRGNAASLTNVQEAGVDEGGIVKRHGDHLVILRRGRLFTVAVGDAALRPVDAVDAFGPGYPPADWYDEMLVSRDRVVVIGYSYARGGTEFSTFDIDAAGGLRYEATYDLRSNDYYSSRNYASRLVGTRLVFYTPLAVRPGEDDVHHALPALRRVGGPSPDDQRDAGRSRARTWSDVVGNAEDGRAPVDTAPFRPIAPPGRVYRPAHPLPPSADVTLHTVAVCDLAAADVRCDATVVIGPSARTFYVSGTAVYVWTSGWPEGGPAEGAGELASDGASPGIADGATTASAGPRAARATLYRMPLDGAPPQALDVRGSPVDQFAFQEGEDGYLSVLVRADAAGDGMWRAESAAADVALLRVPLASFGAGGAAAPDARYRVLPAPAGGVAHDRFVGPYLVYGAGAPDGDAPAAWGRGTPATGGRVYVVPVAGGEVATVALPHAVERIEAMGADAVVVGAAGRDLHFTGVRLDARAGGRPAPAQHFVLPNAAQGETRSHGFFYREDGDGTGVLGLPVRAGGASPSASLATPSAAVEYVRNANGRFTDLGVLAAGGQFWGARADADDGCQVSCEDWYGNARPLFLGRRTLALLGYELVEGEVRGGQMREVRRARFAPRATLAGARP